MALNFGKWLLSDTPNSSCRVCCLCEASGLWKDVDVSSLGMIIQLKTYIKVMETFVISCVSFLFKHPKKRTCFVLFCGQIHYSYTVVLFLSPITRVYTYTVVYINQQTQLWGHIIHRSWCKRKLLGTTSPCQSGPRLFSSRSHKRHDSTNIQYVCI